LGSRFDTLGGFPEEGVENRPLPIGHNNVCAGTPETNVDEGRLTVPGDFEPNDPVAEKVFRRDDPSASHPGPQEIFEPLMASSGPGRMSRRVKSNRRILEADPQPPRPGGAEQLKIEVAKIVLDHFLNVVARETKLVEDRVDFGAVERHYGATVPRGAESPRPCKTTRSRGSGAANRRDAAIVPAPERRRAPLRLRSPVPL
jgi:hypothetical protein